MRGDVEPWEGGYIRQNAEGRGIYIIRRRVGGKPGIGPRYRGSSRVPRDEDRG